MDMTWKFICAKAGATYVQRPVPLPVGTPAEFVDSLWQAVTPRTRIIFLSHITSPTALIFPLAEICKRARKAGIMTIIDGAHAPGQIPLDLTALDPDFYSGNCHKWLCAPKGAGFLYTRAEHRATLEPLVITWGFQDDSTYVTRNQWQGTRDIAGFLSVPAAIEFQQANDWPEVRERCHALVSETRQRIGELTGLPPISPDSTEWYAQMATIALPPVDAEELKRRLYHEYRVEVPLVTRGDSNYVRVSIQGYNTREDADRLLAALTKLLPEVSKKRV
jgi:isopenicillin-N epimerase